MKITVIGANGMLGSDLVAAARQALHTVHALDLPAINITDPASVKQALPETDVVVNCAAYTQVDKAEEERDLAFRINADGAGILARACAARGVRLLHLSTDYVFSGESDRPWREDDEPAPLNAYGAGKLAGEQQVRAAGGATLIVRVESLFGRNGKNFVKTIATHLLNGRRDFQVVADQVSSPTYTRHAAAGLLRLLDAGRTGTVHMTAAGSCSWHAFARAIAERLAPDAVLEPVPSEAYPLPAKRPRYSVMDNARYTAWTGTQLPAWREGLNEYLKEEGWI